MRKRGLKDVKRRNRQVIVESVMESGGLSRTEITQKTELAASTVSTLVGELLHDGILTEAGTVTTAGRSRTELTVNPAYGSISVVEIGRKQTCVTCFDMALKKLKTAVLSRHYLSGNELLERIVNCINAWQEDVPPLVGIGLLFQEDMRESDFRVMYSTGFSSASITLREALMTQYRVAVEEQYSVVYTVTNALSKEVDLDARNSAHISVGSRVIASVTLDGREVPIRKNFCEEFAVATEPEGAEAGNDDWQRLLQYLGNLITMLCLLFPLETVFLSCAKLPPEEAAEDLRRLTRGRIPPGQLPQLKFLRSASAKGGSAALAQQVLRKILITT